MDAPTIVDLVRAALADRAPVLRETHVSWVVLAGTDAFKLKKPVGFPFLDHRTAEARWAACRAEVDLNRRLCPTLYRGAVDAGAHFGVPALAGEPVVWMRRLDEEALLADLLERGAVSVGDVAAVARTLARFHATVDAGPAVAAHGTAARVRAAWESNAVAARPVVAPLLPAGAFEALDAAVSEFLSDHAELFARRHADGFVRDGHGDSHAGNVCLSPDGAEIFDCIEFDPGLRCADAAKDVAFLVADFDRRERPDLAAAFVGAYVAASGDVGAREVLPYYRCYAALVRALVLGLRAGEDAPGRAEAAAYARAAIRAARELPTRIAVPVG